jgi:adenosylhomocysteine nucleosidase
VRTEIPHLGILAGLQSEARCISPYLPSSAALTAEIALSGARILGSRSATNHLIETGATHLLSFGLAGGLDPTLAPGTLLLPDVVLMPDGTRLSVDRRWHANLIRLLQDLAPVCGPHLGADDAVMTRDDKAHLFGRWDALSVDMESHVLAAAARRANLPFAVIRVVCDPAAAGLPPAAAIGVKEDGATNYRAILSSVILHPAQIPALVRLGRAAAAAQKTLRDCARRPGLFALDALVPL